MSTAASSASARQLQSGANQPANDERPAENGRPIVTGTVADEAERLGLATVRRLCQHVRACENLRTFAKLLTTHTVARRCQLSRLWTQHPEEQTAERSRSTPRPAARYQPSGHVLASSIVT